MKDISANLLPVEMPELDRSIAFLCIVNYICMETYPYYSEKGHIMWRLKVNTFSYRRKLNVEVQTRSAIRKLNIIYRSKIWTRLEEFLTLWNTVITIPMKIHIYYCSHIYLFITTLEVYPIPYFPIGFKLCPGFMKNITLFKKHKTRA